MYITVMLLSLYLNCGGKKMIKKYWFETSNMYKYDEWSWNEMLAYKQILKKIYYKCNRKTFILNFAKNKN